MSNLISIPTIGEPYHYETSNCEFTFRMVPTKGRDLSDMQTAFIKFSQKSDLSKDLILYRTFQKNYWKFWKWREYFTYDKWKYPYKPPC